MRTIFAVLAALVVCATPLRAQAPKAIAPSSANAISVDSSAAIALIYNFWPVAAHIYAKTDAEYSELGLIPPGHHAIYVLPARTLKAAKFIFLLAMPEGTHELVELGTSTRVPGKLNIIQAQLGEPPKPAPRT